jgi:hypothetical protein
MTPEEFADYILDYGPLTGGEYSWLTKGQAMDYLDVMRTQFDRHGQQEFERRRKQLRAFYLADLRNGQVPDLRPDESGKPPVDWAQVE